MDDHQQWDIVSGVGITALAVAAGRAIETAQPEGLVRDPFAAKFVSAANAPTAFPGQRRAEDAPRAEADHWWDAIALHMGLRSRFLDDYFLRSQESGIRQAVILASGLDARAFRLGWQPGTTVFEIDQPKVLEFKDRVLASHDAHPESLRRCIAMDLREEWASPLREAGFDRKQPSAWLAEGLFPYLTQRAEERLLTTIDRLAAPGSTLALEYLVNPEELLQDPSLQEAAAAYGIDMASLMSADQMDDPALWLSESGWSVTTRDSADLARSYGRELSPSFPAFARHGRYLTARKD